MTKTQGHLKVAFAKAYHHGHLMQGRLPIEDHHVPILQVSLNLVAKLQVAITVFPKVAQVQPLSILSQDVLGASLAHRRVGAILYQLLQPEKAKNILEIGHSFLQVQSIRMAAHERMRELAW